MQNRDRYNAGKAPSTLDPALRAYLTSELRAIARGISGALTPTYNTSRIAQGPGFNADTYIAGSELLVPAAGWQFGTMLEWLLVATKTAAGVASPVFTLRGGRTRTTADSFIATVTGTAQTAAADNAIITIYATIQDLTTLTGTLRLAMDMRHDLATTGFASTIASFYDGVTSVNVPAFGGQYIGLSLDAGAAAAWTISQVRARALW